MAHGEFDEESARTSDLAAAETAKSRRGGHPPFGSLIPRLGSARLGSATARIGRPPTPA